jgi:hypothetical protein
MNLFADSLQRIAERARSGALGGDGSWLADGIDAQAGISGLQGEVDAINQAMAAHRRELAEMPRHRAELLLTDDADEALDRLELAERSVYRKLEKLTMQAAALEERMVEMRFAQIQPRIDFHRDQLRAASEQVEQAVKAAMRANAVAFAAFEAVVEELGRHNANHLMPLVHFAGGLNEPSLEIWRQQLSDQHERIARQQGRSQ